MRGRTLMVIGFMLASVCGMGCEDPSAGIADTSVGFADSGAARDAFIVFPPNNQDGFVPSGDARTVFPPDYRMMGRCERLISEDTIAGRVVQDMVQDFVEDGRRQVLDLNAECPNIPIYPMDLRVVSGEGAHRIDPTQRGQANETYSLFTEAENERLGPPAAIMEGEACQPTTPLFHLSISGYVGDDGSIVQREAPLCGLTLRPDEHPESEDVCVWLTCWSEAAGTFEPHEARVGCLSLPIRETSVRLLLTPFRYTDDADAAIHLAVLARLQRTSGLLTRYGDVALEVPRWHRNNIGFMGPLVLNEYLYGANIAACTPEELSADRLLSLRLYHAWGSQL